MLDTTRSLDLTQYDLDLIEQALQTQEKILTVQSRAGGAQARERLNDVKGLIRRLGSNAGNNDNGMSQSWTRMARSLFC